MGKTRQDRRRRDGGAPSGKGVRIYTRRGDFGETDLPALGRIAKSHPRLAASGALDELNCAIGEVAVRIEASSFGGRQGRAVLRRVKRVQGELFLLGSLLSGAGRCTRGPTARHRAMVRRLETEIEAMEGELPRCRGFLVPGGDPLASAAHLARAICRRAERDCTAAVGGEPAVRRAGAILPYLNRLSDWLFVLARWLAKSVGGAEEYWRRPAAVHRQDACAAKKKSRL